MKQIMRIPRKLKKGKTAAQICQILTWYQFKMLGRFARETAMSFERLGEAYNKLDIQE